MSENTKLTIFTPTYNRGKELKRLYNSLVHQTCPHFTWLIVDDGSSDQTKDIVSEMISENKIDISYFYQENQGKMIAHNKGVEMTKTDLFICVDSDDILLPEAVDKILANCHLEDNSFAGWIFLRGKPDGSPLGTPFTDSMLENAKSLTDLYEKYHFLGDTALVFRTSIIKQYRFDLYPGEKFIGEDYLYKQIEKDYDFLPVNDIFYITEYQADGYSENVTAHIMKSPHNYIKLKQICLETSSSVKYKLIHGIILDAMVIKIKDWHSLFQGKCVALKVILFPLGFVYYMLRFRSV